MSLHKLTLISLVYIATSSSAHAENIDIDMQCEQMAENITMRLIQEGMLSDPDTNENRARLISLEVCQGKQQSVQQQHEEGIQDALKNWLTQPTGGKAGNKRLKNLKR
jgi:hypothetical protein